MHFVHCKRIPEQAKMRFVAESTTLLLFFDLLCSFGFHKQIAKTLYCLQSLQNRQFCGICNIICGIHNQVIHLRNPLAVAESRTTSYILLLRNPRQNKYADNV